MPEDVMRAFLVAALMLATADAYAAAGKVDAPELCPIDPDNQSLGVKAISATKEDQGTSVFVDCHYQKGTGADIGSIGLRAFCPSKIKLIAAGYSLNGPSKTDLRITTFTPGPGSGETDYNFLTVTAVNKTANLDVDVTVYCRP